MVRNTTVNRRSLLRQAAAAAAGVLAAPFVASGSDRAASGAPISGFPFEVFSVPGSSVLAELGRLTRQNRGYPVLLGGSEDLERLREGEQVVAWRAEELVQAALGIDAERWFADALERAGLSADDVPHGEWPADAAPAQSITGHLDLLTGQPRVEAFVGVLPIRDSWRAPCVLGFGGWNECPVPEEHAAVFKYWHALYGADVATIASDVVELTVRQPPGTREQALRLAMEQYAYCPDIVDQGTESIEVLAASLLGARAWFFWWD